MIVNANTSLRTRHIATKVFGADNMAQPLTAVPRSRYMFYARFVPNSTPTLIFPWLTQLGTAEQGVSFKIKTIDKPNISLETVELNQYNRKRLAYTKIDYQSVTIKMYDTVDNRPLQMWKDYFMYYFGDSRPNKSILMNQQTVSSTFTDSTGWGFRPVAEQTAFFSRLEIYNLFGRKYTKTAYLNPKIVSINWQDYESSSSDPDELSIVLKYEAIEYTAEQLIDNTMSRLFGFEIDMPPIEPPAAINAENTYAMRASVDSTGIVNSTATQTLPSSIISPSNSVITQFGLNSNVYDILQNSPTPGNALFSAASTNYATPVTTPLSFGIESPTAIPPVTPSVPLNYFQTPPVTPATIPPSSSSYDTNYFSPTAESIPFYSITTSVLPPSDMSREFQELAARLRSGVAIPSQTPAGAAQVSQNIQGIPGNSLPAATGSINGTETLSSAPPLLSPLSVYGDFNFGVQ